MKFKLIWLAMSLNTQASADTENFQYDYCSWTHSQHVIDKVKSEVNPLFATYGIQMIQNSPSCSLSNFGLVEDQLKFFGHKKVVKKNHVCSVC